MQIAQQKKEGINKTSGSIKQDDKQKNRIHITD